MALTPARTMPGGVLELPPLDQIAFQGMLDTVRSISNASASCRSRRR